MRCPPGQTLASSTQRTCSSEESDCKSPGIRRPRTARSLQHRDRKHESGAHLPRDDRAWRTSRAKEAATDAGGHLSEAARRGSTRSSHLRQLRLLGSNSIALFAATIILWRVHTSVA